MSHENDSTRKPRKSRGVRKDSSGYYPAVTFDGAESIEIPADGGKSPVSTHLSLASNPSEFKFMDEIALLKRGRIDKDAPKHPYNRRVPEQQSEPSTDESRTSVLSSTNSAIMTLMKGTPTEEQTYALGNGGQLKYSRMREGGERYELSTQEDVVSVYQQSEGQTCLFTFKLN